MTVSVTSLTNLFGNTASGTVAGTSGNSSKSFTQVMGTVTNENRSSDTYRQSKDNVKADQSTKLKDTADAKVSDRNFVKNKEALDKKIGNTNESDLKEDALAKINEKAEELIASIAEKLDVSEDDVRSAMEVLGMTNGDLLNSELLSQLVVTVSGEDMMSLVMDEGLYGDLKDLLQTVDSMKTELTEALGISQEELSKVLEQAAKLSANDLMSGTQAVNTAKDTTEADVEINIDTDADTQIQAQTDHSAESTKNQQQGNTAEADGKVPAQSETQTGTQIEITTVKEKVSESALESEEIIEKPLESLTQQTGTQGKNTEQGYQENDHSFLQSLTETAANIAEHVNANETDASFTNVLHAQDTESIMKQMVDSMKLHVNASVSEMEIQLHPANLGTVNLNIASKNGVITAQFTAQNETVKEALESQIVQLRENLDERGIKVEAIEVTVASHEFERNLEQGEQEARDSEQTEAAKKTGRRRIVLNQGESEDSEEMDIDGLEAADRLQVELMRQQGNTVSLMA